MASDVDFSNIYLYHDDNLFTVWTEPVEGCYIYIIRRSLPADLVI